MPRWEAIVYGKLIRADLGPIISGNDYQWTEASGSFPRDTDLQSNLRPSFFGLGHPTSFDWGRYVWVGTMGGIIVRSLTTSGNTYLIAARIRPRWEGGEILRSDGNHEKMSKLLQPWRWYTQSLYLVIDPQRVAYQLPYLDLPSKLVAMPTVGQVNPATKPVVVPESPSRPFIWGDIRETLRRLLRGEAVTILSSSNSTNGSVQSPDDFYNSMITPIWACLPAAIRWRLPVGAGLVSHQADEYMLGQAMNHDRPPPSLRLGSAADADNYMNWIEGIASNATDIKSLANAVDDDFKILNEIDLPKHLPWSESLPILFWSLKSIRAIANFEVPPNVITSVPPESAEFLESMHRLYMQSYIERMLVDRRDTVVEDPVALLSSCHDETVWEKVRKSRPDDCLLQVIAWDRPKSRHSPTPVSLLAFLKDGTVYSPKMDMLLRNRLQSLLTNMNLQITNGRKDKSFTEELELLQRIAEDIPESFSISHAFWTAPLIRLRRNAMLYLELNDPEGIGISQLVSDLNSSSHSGSIDKKSEELFSRCGSLAWDRKHYWAFLVIRFYKFGDVDPLSLYRSIQDAVGRQVDCKLWSEVISSIHAHSDELQDRPDKIIASLTYTLPPVNAEIFNEDQVRSLFKILQTVPYNDRFDSYGRQVIHIALNYSDVYKAFFQENNWGTLREGALALGLHDWALDASSQPPEEEYSKLNYLWRSYHADQREGQDLPEHVSEFREILAFTRKYMHNESVVPMHSKHEGEYGSEAGDVLLALISGNGLLKTDEYPNKILSLKSKIAFTKWSLNLSRDSDWIEVLEKDLKKASAPIVRSALLSCGRHADERARALGDKEEKKVARLSTKEILKLSSRGWDVTSVLSNPWRSNDWSFNIDRTEAEELIAAAIRLDVRGIDGRKSMRRWIGSKLFCNRQILDINPSRFPSKWEVFWDKVLRRRLSRGRSWDKSLRYYARFMDSETVNEIQKLREESVEIENTTERIGGNYWSSGKVFITVCIVMLLIGVVWYFFGNRYFVGGALEFLLPMVKILDKWFRLW